MGLGFVGLKLFFEWIVFMSRDVVISGIGPVTALGLTVDEAWPRLVAGESGLKRIAGFDASGFESQLGAEVPEFKIGKMVPKSYRKATKVMARDIEIAVIAADAAVKDAKLVTKGVQGTEADLADAALSYEPSKVGCHIGAGLIAMDIDEITAALASSKGVDGKFDIHHWGEQGMNNLTPLWLLKYLPNMLACHVTIVHDCQGPSNTITCTEASGGLSVGESFGVIQRGQADACLCGGAESKMNPFAFFRQSLTGWLSTANDEASASVKAFDTHASGTVVGEGGAVLVLEAAATCEARGGEAYAKVLSVAGSQSVNRATKNTTPDAEGAAMAAAMRRALQTAGLEAGDVDAVFAHGMGHEVFDQPEAAALRAVFGEGLSEVPVVSTKPMVGVTGAGSSAIDVAIAAKSLKEGQLPAIVNRDTPLLGFEATAVKGELKTVLCLGTGLGGQNTVTVLGKC